MNIRVFISSPGDVADERNLARALIKDQLPYDPFLRGRVTFDVVSWDDAAAPTPMLASLTPQESVNSANPKPSECHIVIIVLWSRMGTPLTADTRKPNGEAYRSGTEWEYYDALTASPRPDILIYHRTEPVRIDIDDPEFDTKRHQYQLVKAFFDQFQDADGSLSGSYSDYDTPTAFKDRLSNDLKALLRRQLEKRATVATDSLAVAQTLTPSWSGAPYPGLRAFGSGEGPIFFGRGRETDALIRRLKDPAQRFLAVVGASGTGKSSLIRAGVLPRLQDGALDDSTWCKLVELAPGEAGGDPFLALAYALRDVLSEQQKQSPVSLAKRLAENPHSLRDLVFVGESTPTSGRAVMFIDQLEELFTQVNESYRAPFINLIDAATSDSRFRIISSLRADFLAVCAEEQFLQALLQSGTFPLGPPGTASMLEMIEGPAQRAGVHLEDGLADRILTDAGNDPGALPLVAFCLETLHRRGHECLSLRAYEELGGLWGAIGQQAAKIISELSASDGERAVEAALPKLFEKLVYLTPAGTPARQKVNRNQLSADPVVNGVIDKMIDRRLLIAGDANGEATIEFSHEALFRGWPALREWIEGNRSQLMLCAELALDVRRWKRSGEDAEFLMARGKRLDSALTLAEERPDLLDPFAQAFIAASQARARRQDEQEQEWTRRECARLAELALSETANGNAVNGILAALEALPLLKTSAEGEPPPLSITSALYGAVGACRERLNLCHHEDSVTSVAFDPQGRIIATACIDGQARLWDAANGTLLHVLDGHENWINSIQFSPDGARVLCASLDATARVWNTKDGAPTLVLRGHEGLLYTATFAPERALILTTSDDGTSRIWDANTGEIVMVLEHKKAAVPVAVFSPTAEAIITGSVDGSAHIWDAATGQSRAILEGHKGPLHVAGFSSCGTRAFTAGEDGQTRLWEVVTGRLLQVLTGHEDAVLSGTFSPDGKTLITASRDTSARIWDVATGRQVGELHGHDGAITDVAVNDSAMVIVTTSDDGSARLWQAKSGQAMAVLRGHDAAVRCVAFDTAGKHVLTGSDDQTARVWSITPEQTIVTCRGHDGPVSMTAFAPDSTRIASASVDQTARIWDSESGSLLLTLKGHSGPVHHVAFSPDGKILASASRDGTVRLWDGQSGNSCSQITDHENAVSCVAFSPDGKLLATVSWDRTVRLWGTSDGLPIYTMRGHEERIYTVAFSPCGQCILTASEDQTIRLWDTATAHPKATFTDHEGSVYVARFSPDGRTIASASYDRTVRLWDVATHKCLSVLCGHNGYVSTLAFNPQGDVLASGAYDGSVRLWNAESGQLRATLAGHGELVNVIAFSSEGSKVISASEDGTISLWDAQTGKALTVLRGHEGAVRAVACSPDSRKIVSASEDCTIRIWPLFQTAEALVQYAQNILPRQLTEAQRKQFSLL